MTKSTRITEMTPSERDEPCQSVVIRPMPKVVLFWPTLLVALLCTMGMYLSPEFERGWGRTFLLVLFLNFLIMAFDFSPVAAIALTSVVSVLILTAVLTEYQVYDYLPVAANWLDHASPTANIWFYGLVAAGLIVTYASVWLVYRHFNYWEVTHNEIVHHVGVGDAVRRYPTQRLSTQKEITDVFELWLLRSGRLVLYADGVPEAIVLENVRNINDVEQRVQEMLQVIRVEDIGTGHNHGRGPAHRADAL